MTPYIFDHGVDMQVDPSVWPFFFLIIMIGRIIGPMELS